MLGREVSIDRRAIVWAIEPRWKRNSMAWWEAIKPKSREKVKVGNLSFDFDNPRFTPEKRPASDTDGAVIAHLAASADLGELIQSISASGYVDIEPLIVIGRGDRLVVLEGNRRLAALKALRDPKLAASSKLSVPALSPDKVASLDEVSVYRVLDASEARDIIGFKHINGPQAWDAYAKALYAADWLNIEKAKRDAGQPGLTVTDIAQRMGDKHDTIFRIVTAAYVLEQAEQTRAFLVDDRATKNFAFSHLYTALTYVEFKEFIDLNVPERGGDPIRAPVPDARLPELSQLLRWLYGSKSESVEPVVKRQNPDLGRLKRVLGDPRSRRVMLERNSLDEAIESTTSSSERFEKSIVDAEQSLKNAQSALDGYDAADLALMDIGRSVFEKARLIFRHMEAEVRERAEAAGDNANG